MAKIIPKIGVFFNDPEGRVSGSLDLEALAAKTAKIKGVKHVAVVAELSRENTIEVVEAQLQSEAMDRVLWIGSFPDAFKTQALRALAEVGLNKYMHHWVDPADQGLLNQQTDAAVRQKKAVALLQMAVARVKNLAPLDPLELPANERVAVIGAGVTGLHIAATLIEAGKPVTLVEQAAGLGGKVAQLARFYPLMCDPRCGLEHVLFDLMESEMLDLRTLSKVERVDGSPGNFELTVRSAPRYVTAACDGCGLCQEACPVVIDDTSPQPLCKLPAEVQTELWTPKKDATADENGQANPQDADTSEAKQAPDAAVEAAEAKILNRLSVPPVQRPPRFRRKAIHPAAPMPQPVAYVVERERCPEGCRACADVCPQNALELDQEEKVEAVSAGAVVAATGWDLYELERLKDYGFGEQPNVISSLEMERLLAAEDPHSERLEGFSPGDFKTVGFIQCAGSRDEKHLDYCSGVCCSATLKQIQELRRINPDVRCFVYYMHIRTPGFDERMWREVREGGNVVFIRERPAQVGFDPESGKAVIESLDEVLGKRVRTEMDLLVLAGGMQPSRDGLEAGKVLRLPTDAYGFFESHRQCYPAESQRTGIFAAGCAREPMNVAQSVESGVSAAMRTMPFLQGTLRVEPTYPDINDKKCDSCGRCVEECPFAVLKYNEKEIPVPDLARCRQCGNCMGICPKIAVDLRNSTIKQYASQIEVLSENTFLSKEEPIVCAFLCENDAWLAHCLAQRQGRVPPGVVALPVPCSGAVNNALIADALSYGIDGVYIGACPDGTCHYVRGNELIRKRRDDLADKLKTMRMEPERVAFEGLGPRDVERYAVSLSEYVGFLKEKGPNPFKM
jgi:heterodisulfide reductase subunit A-like polyferredoxin/coenzyme F420-reducing hydrogenase delta subunit